MRKFLALLLTVAMQVAALPVAGAEGVSTATELRSVCSACDSDPNNIVYSWEEYGETHHVIKCSHGVALQRTKQSHQTDRENYKNDNVEHWFGCVICGAKEDPWKHSESCVKPGECGACGAKNVVFGDQIYHNVIWGLDKVEHDELHHWYTCQDCGVRVDEGIHMAYCDRPDYCFKCNATGIQANRIKHDDTSCQYDDQFHWLVCNRCGETQGDVKNVHVDSCANRGICTICGASNVIFNWTTHDEEYKKLSS